MPDEPGEQIQPEDRPGAAAKERDDAINPYLRDSESVQEPPVGFGNTLKFLGPGLILAGSVVGSGEIILTTTFGATVGFVMLWWLLLSCWGKSFVQAELARYTVSSGETVLNAFNRLPGKLPGLKGKVSWFIWLWLLTIIPNNLLGGGGIYGAVGQTVQMGLPFLDSRWWTIIFAALASALILTGTYRLLEKLMIFMVFTFTLVTLVCAFSLQFTPSPLPGRIFRRGWGSSFPHLPLQRRWRPMALRG